MLKDLTAGTQVYLVTGYTDLRRSIDGLAEIVQGQLHLDPFSKALFLFCGRRRDRIKGLLWEGDGFLLLYKRLDNGNFQWPRNETEARLLTPQHGNVPIDNNRAENAIRPFAVGRKNWLFSNTANGAKYSAALYSIVATAQANGLDAERFLTDLFSKPAGTILLPFDT